MTDFFKSYKAVSSEMAFNIWRARLFWSDYMPGTDISNELVSTGKKKGKENNEFIPVQN